MTALILGLLLVTGVLAIWQARARQQGRRAPFERLLHEVLAPSVRGAGTMRNLVTTDPQYQMDPLSPVGLERLRAAEEENTRLRGLLALRDATAKSALAAEVIGRSTTPWQGYLQLGKGQAEGVAESMVAITPDGVVGQVTAVYAHTAEVLPLVDPASGIGAVTTRARVFGVLKGWQGGLCRMVYLTEQADIQPGDVVVTSSLSRIFPSGLKLGTVEQVEQDPGLSSRIALVRPAANLEQASFVLLVKYADTPAVAPPVAPVVPAVPSTAPAAGATPGATPR